MTCPDHKNDKIAQDVLEELQWDPRISEENIRVTAKSGEVSLTGYTGNLLSSRSATDAAWRVEGVELVRNDLRVQLPYKDWKKDEQIAEMARQFLDWNVLIDTDIGVTVENGWVTLTGEVISKVISREAESIITRIRGVKGLSNLIKVKPEAATTDTAARIKKALTRNRCIVSDQIQINASRGTVKVTGDVDTWQQREEIMAIVWSAPGIQSVKSNIKIKGS